MFYDCVLFGQMSQLFEKKKSVDIFKQTILGVKF